MMNETVEECMKLIKSGKVRNHLLRETSRIHSGQVEHLEYITFRDFLPSKNACIVYELRGSEIY